MPFREFLYAFIPIFVAMDVAGIIPVYLTLTKNLSEAEKKKVSVQALSTAFLISLIFIAIGRWIFRLIGISVADFEIAGGILLMVLAIVEMLHLGREPTPGAHVGPVPLGTPMIVGPAVLTSLIILIPLYGYVIALSALLANLLILGFAFGQSRLLIKWLREDGLRAMSQVISLFLAAIAVSMIHRGLLSFH
jgi:multiple antibiotic resistance protein